MLWKITLASYIFSYRSWRKAVDRGKGNIQLPGLSVKDLITYTSEPGENVSVRSCHVQNGAKTTFTLL